MHKDQTGVVKRRYIEENIRIISDVLDLFVPDNLVALDFRKLLTLLNGPL